MLRKLVKQVSAALGGSGEGKTSRADRDHVIRMATAILMVDVAKADSDFHESEFTLLLDLVERYFGLTPNEASELASAAHLEAEELVEISRFTQLLHDNLSEAEKVKVVNLLWKIAFADGRLSKHEDSLVLKISDLLYVNRATVMRLKHDAQLAAQ